MIDWDRVSELRDEIGAEDFGEVVEIFLEEVDAAIEALGDGADSLEAQLHFLKGSALNLGFDAFASLCQKGESAANQGDTGIDTDAVKQSYATSRSAFVTGLETRFAA